MVKAIQMSQRINPKQNWPSHFYLKPLTAVTTALWFLGSIHTSQVNLYFLRKAQYVARRYSTSWRQHNLLTVLSFCCWVTGFQLQSLKASCAATMENRPSIVVLRLSYPRQKSINRQSCILVLQVGHELREQSRWCIGEIVGVYCR